MSKIEKIEISQSERNKAKRMIESSGNLIISTGSLVIINKINELIEAHNEAEEKPLCSVSHSSPHFISPGQQPIDEK